MAGDRLMGLVMNEEDSVMSGMVKARWVQEKEMVGDVLGLLSLRERRARSCIHGWD